MHGLAVYVKKGLPFAQDLFIENSADSYYILDWLYFIQYLTSFSSINHFLHLHAVFNSISYSIDEVLSTNPSANVFVFVYFNIHHKVWLTYSDGTDIPGKLCYNFSTSNELIKMVNFPTWISDCDSQSCFFGFISIF